MVEHVGVFVKDWQGIVLKTVIGGYEIDVVRGVFRDSFVRDRIVLKEIAKRKKVPEDAKKVYSDLLISWALTEHAGTHREEVIPQKASSVYFISYHLFSISVDLSHFSLLRKVFPLGTLS